MEESQPESYANSETHAVFWRFGLVELPECALTTNSLTFLDCRYNKIRALPENLANLLQLQHLDLTDNLLTSLPPTLGYLTCIRRLFLTNNKITKIPDSVGSLCLLETLRVDRNKLYEIPYHIGNLVALRYLGLCHNHITSLPPEVALLTRLIWLGLDGNPMILPTSSRIRDAAPAAVGEPRVLSYAQDEQEADVCHAEGRSALTREAHDGLLGFLARQLVAQDHSGAGLDQLPAAVLRTRSLQSLRLGRNRLGPELPAGLEGLRELRVLDLSDNQLTGLPSALVALQALEELNLSGNRLTTRVLPPSPPRNAFAAARARLVARRGAGEAERAGGRDEEECLPESLAALPRLVTLLLAGNRLRFPPPVLAHLGLARLDLSKNQLERAPGAGPGSRLAGSLRVLSLADNRLRSLGQDDPSDDDDVGPGPDSAAALLTPDEAGAGAWEGLVFLEELLVEGNRLADLPNSLCRCAGLRLLWAGDNRLRALPVELGRLAGLQSLRLEKNQLRTVPLSLGACRQLADLALESNPDLYQPPPDTLAQGPSAVLAYLRQRQAAHPAGPLGRGAGGVRYLNQECRLLRVFCEGDQVLADLEEAVSGRRLAGVPHHMLA